MGNTPSVKYENMTTEEIVEAVKSLGKEFATCAQMVDLAGIDGGNVLNKNLFWHGSYDCIIL